MKRLIATPILLMLLAVSAIFLCGQGNNINGQYTVIGSTAQLPVTCSPTQTWLLTPGGVIYTCQSGTPAIATGGTPGPTGPTGPTGPSGATGPSGPNGSNVGGSVYCAATGFGSNVGVCTPASAISSYFNGMQVIFTADASNTGSSTINISGQGAKTLKTNTGANLSAGMLKTGTAYSAAYDGTNFNLVLGGNPQYITTYTSQSTAVTITGSTHGQGPYPIVQCISGTGTGAAYVLCPAQLDLNGTGTVTLAFSSSNVFTGTVIISGGGYANAASSGAAGPTGPAGATGATGPSGPAGAGVFAYLPTSSCTPACDSGTSRVTLGSSALNITWSGINGGYTSMQLRCSGRTDTSATTENIFAFLNADTTADYQFQYISGAVSTASAGNINSIAGAFLGQLTGASATSGYQGQIITDFLSYSGSTFFKNWTSSIFLTASATNTQSVELFGGVWQNTGAITSIQIFPQTTAKSFIAGTVCALYGIN